MDERRALLAFAALSQATRLHVMRNLVVAGADGLAAGRIAELVGVSSSNISFHLKELEHAGLVAVRRDSRSLIYSARFDALGGLVEFLVRDCSDGHPRVSRAATPPMQDDRS